jgi:energy-coupling factor transporter ATP-binding protein EcfA2
MTKASNSPWLARFPELTNTQIRTAITRYGPELTDLGRIHPNDASSKLQNGLEQVFVATNSIVSMLADMHSTCRVHCEAMYPTPGRFLERVYSKAPENPSYRARCLTGPAGVGKSRLLEALSNLLPTPSTISIDEHHDAFQMLSHLLISVRAKASPKAILASLVELVTSKPVSTTDMRRLHELLRRQIYLTGVPMLLADEFQFATGSANANTLITQILYLLAELGVPLVYCANYSLIHRLKRRPQEDRQRLLSNPMILLPDPAESNDWSATVAGYLAVAPEIFDLDAKEHAAELHRYSGGLKRLLVRLLCLAYYLAPGGQKRKVKIADVARAYKSTAFAVDRTDLEITLQQAIINKQITADLWCPFDLPSATNIVIAQPAIDAQRDRIAEQMVKGVLTPEAFQKMTGTPKRKAPALTKKTSSVVPIERARNGASSLLRGAALVRESVVGSKKQP